MSYLKQLISIILSAGAALYSMTAYAEEGKVKFGKKFIEYKGEVADKKIEGRGTMTVTMVVPSILSNKVEREVRSITGSFSGDTINDCVITSNIPDRWAFEGQARYTITQNENNPNGYQFDLQLLNGTFRLYGWEVAVEDCDMLYRIITKGDNTPDQIGTAQVRTVKVTNIPSFCWDGWTVEKPVMYCRDFLNMNIEELRGELVFRPVGDVLVENLGLKENESYDDYIFPHFMDYAKMTIYNYRMPLRDAYTVQYGKDPFGNALVSGLEKYEGCDSVLLFEHSYVDDYHMSTQNRTYGKKTLFDGTIIKYDKCYDKDSYETSLSLEVTSPDRSERYVGTLTGVDDNTFAYGKKFGIISDNGNESDNPDQSTPYQRMKNHFYNGTLYFADGTVDTYTDGESAMELKRRRAEEEMDRVKEMLAREEAKAKARAAQQAKRDADKAAIKKKYGNNWENIYYRNVKLGMTKQMLKDMPGLKWGVVEETSTNSGIVERWKGYSTLDSSGIYEHVMPFVVTIKNGKVVSIKYL